ncbi:MAG: cytochrome b/b6 domain-containing protein [Pseudomonadales bacterium]|nr:cytochrome b/b6 domain-containing protein [Pseudomonadales bacterium]
MPDAFIVRHSLAARVVHWSFALLVLVLAGTGLLPAYGVKFDWLGIHWISGVILLALLVLHIVHALLRKSLHAMWIKPQDFTAALPGKYSLAQKLMHNTITLLSLGAVTTGSVMLLKIDTPLWKRNPYWLDADTWGYVYVVHGLVAMGFVSVIMLHVYFSLRPEKRLYLRAMFKGRISATEYHQHHQLPMTEDEKAAE